MTRPVDPDLTQPETLGLSGDARLSSLILRWEEQLGAGREIAVEELCVDCPELAESLAREVAKLRAMRAVIDGPDLPETSLETSNNVTDLTDCLPRDEPAGRYTKIRRLGGGGMGIVWLAQDETLGREVAVKEIRSSLNASPDAIARFEREAKVSGGLEHPGIAPVHDLGRNPDGTLYYVMRYVRGGDLQDEIYEFYEDVRAGADSGAKAIAFRRLLDRFIAVCDAVAYAHGRGVLHRDIKPGNIMVGNHGETILVDWGLAKFVRTVEDGEGVAFGGAGDADSALTADGSALGTAAYMSPEQASRQTGRVGPPADVYGLGATLYCILTGIPPFRAPTVLEVLDLVVRGDFLRPAAVRTGVPRALEEICLKAMSLQAEDRYSSPRTLADEVERWLGDEPVHVYRDPLPKRMSRWVRKHKAAVIVATILLFASIAGLLIDDFRVSWQRERADKGFSLARGAVSDIITKIAKSDLAAVPRSEALRRQVVEAARFYNESFLAQAPNDPSVRADAAHVYREAGNILRMLGDVDEALDSYRKAIDLWQRLDLEFSDARDHRALLALTLADAGSLFLMQGRPLDAEPYYLRSLGVAEAAIAKDARNGGPRRAKALALMGLAGVQLESEREQEAKESAAKAVALLAPQAFQTEDALLLAMAFQTRGEAARATGELADAELHARRSIGIVSSIEANPGSTIGEIPTDVLAPNLQFIRAQSRIVMGSTLAALPARKADAARTFDLAIASLQKLCEAYPRLPHYRRLLAEGHHARARLRAKEAYVLAEADCGQAITILEELAKTSPQNAVVRGTLGRALADLAQATLERGEAGAARSLFARAAEELKASLDLNPGSRRNRDVLKAVQ